MPDSKALFDMSELDITKADRTTLADISAVSIPAGLPHAQQVFAVIEQMGNPYCFLSGDTPVRIRFAPDAKPLSEILINYFSQLRHR